MSVAMTIRRYMLGVTFVGVIGGVSPALGANSDFQAQNHDSCIVELPGDVNLSGAVTSADIIVLVGFVFRTGDEPEPCRGAGDVNCTGGVTSADIIYTVNYVFKGGPRPCDICSSANIHLGCVL